MVIIPPAVDIPPVIFPGPIPVFIITVIVMPVKINIPFGVMYMVIGLFSRPVAFATFIIFYRFIPVLIWIYPVNGSVMLSPGTWICRFINRLIFITGAVVTSVIFPLGANRICSCCRS